MKRVFVIAGTSLVIFVLGVTVAELRHRFHGKKPAPWQTLLSFENQDLGNLTADKTLVLTNAIEALTGTKASLYQPRLFGTMGNANGGSAYVLVEERPLIQIPSESRLRVHIFDITGRLLSQSEFSAGWRTELMGMNIRKNRFLNRDMLVVYGNAGDSSSTQHYALAGSAIVLTYLETNGEFERNNYTDSISRIGPLSQRSADEWEMTLNSNDTAEVASVLIWLGGLHWKGQAAPHDEDKSEAQKVSTLLARDSVKERINYLTKSNNLWVDNAAKRVLDLNGL